MGARTPKKCTPLFKNRRLPDHFCEMLGSVQWNGLKMVVLELREQTFFQMIIPPLVLYDSHFCLLTHALKMKPDGLCSRLRKFQKIVILIS